MMRTGCLASVVGGGGWRSCGGSIGRSCRGAGMGRTTRRQGRLERKGGPSRLILRLSMAMRDRAAEEMFGWVVIGTWNGKRRLPTAFIRDEGVYDSMPDAFNSLRSVDRFALHSPIRTPLNYFAINHL